MRTPLCVDMDGTLIYTDTLAEALIQLIKTKPWLIFSVIIWLLHGRPYLKQKISALIPLDPASLPYNAALIAWIKKEKANGREVYLVTAADYQMAEKVAAYTGLFTGVIASDGKKNLKSATKRDELNQRFGKKQYDYAGNSTADLPVWADSKAAIVVNAKPALKQRCEKTTPVAQYFPKQDFTIKDFCKAIRVHQYAKNGLIFVPLLLGQLYSQPMAIWKTLLGFICFSILASSVYVLNDLFDLASDRQHETKCKRAMASGKMSLVLGMIIAPVFFIIAAIISSFLNSAFQMVLLVYYILTLAYSYYLKKKALLDVFTLSALYTLRILAGIAILQEGSSRWLIVFSLFFFTSLAFVKRFTELKQLQASSFETTAHGRGYYVEDLPMITMFGVVSGYIAVLVFAFYVNSEKASMIYKNVGWLYLLCPILIYWVSRIWLKAGQGRLHEDPVVYAIKDRVSYMCLLLALLITVCAIA